MEPNYVGANGRIDAMAAAWLLDEDHMFFLENEITWDGHNHAFTGAQVNAANVDEVPVFMSNYEMLMNGVLDLMTTLEKDEVLRVPRGAIHPSLHGAIREGDLTGITLFNLIACGHAIKIANSQDGVYQVIYDTRLARGIPAFYQLVSRMIWDMREYNGVEGPYQVGFMSARNIDADQYLRDFNGEVPGAVSELMWVEQVDSPPTVVLPSSGDIAAYAEGLSQAFASGFDAPTEMEADEELFKTALSSLTREFPKTMALEGTHVLGRAARIENIKEGDALVLAADWESPYFDPVCIEVFNTAGETIGNLSAEFNTMLFGHRELACLLPHITATVKSVTPLSQRRKGSKHALMDVSLEIDSSILTAGFRSTYVIQPVYDEAKKLLALPPRERVVLSKGDLVASNLKGNVNVTRAKDVSNPVGSVYERSAEEAYVPQLDASSGTEDANTGEEVVDERQAMISMLRVFVLAGELGGNVTFPQELLDELERAENGDESVDVEDLAKRFNEVVPDNKAADLSEISFSEGKTAKGRRFTVAVPDGWSVVENYEENTIINTTRPFVLVQGEVSDPTNLQNQDRIIYSSIGGDNEVEEGSAECGIADFKWALALMARYDKSDNEGIMGLRPNVVWDEEVEAVNTRCFVSQNQPSDGPNGLEVYVTPYALDHNDSLRLVFTYDGEESEGPVRELAKAIARTVELDKPVKPQCEQTLEKALAGKISADEFVTMVASFAKPYLGLRQSIFTSYQYKYATNTDDFNEKECTIAGARGVAESNRRAAIVFDQLLDAYDKQVAAGATKSDLDTMLDSLTTFNDAVFATETVFDDPESVAITASVFEPTQEMIAARKRLDYVKGHGGMASMSGGA